MSDHRPPTFMLVVGEPSGDQLGAQLMAALKRETRGAINIVGVGGPAMSAEGLFSLFPLDDTAVMGLREVVPRIPAILRRVREASDRALKTRPDLVVLIDSPDFTHRIAQRLKKIDRSIRTVNYVAPQVWASRSYRARKMAKYFDAVLALLPFEAPFFEKHGLPARFVGHPALERGERMVGGDLFRQACGIANYRPLLAVLPGSRRNEIRFILPVFKEAVRLLVKEVPDLICVLPTMPHVAQAVHEGTAEWPTPIVVVEGEREKYAAFDAADVALAASGTVTTELALAKTPMVVGYKVGGLTFLLSKPLMNIRFITLINLILDREAVPEFLQDACTPENLATALLPLVRNKLARTKQLSAQAEALRALGQGAEAPSTRAARALLELARR